MKSTTSRSRMVFNAGMAVAVIFVAVSMIASTYQWISGDKSSPNFIKDPEIIALVIGLLVTVLFVDRWRSLEGKVDRLSGEQRDKLKDIQDFSTEQIKLKVEQVVGKAEKVSAQLASINERHPWLQVISERDIVVETESLRGILRTSYMLLAESKELHLYEFLEYCSRKGTPEDLREKKLKLRGTVDDFFEVAAFCETWLEDFALGVEFLKRYIEQAGGAAYAAYPNYARRLLRIGRFEDAIRYSKEIEKILLRERLHRMMPFLPNRTPISDRYAWHAANTLAVAHAALGAAATSAKFAAAAARSPCVSLFPIQQILFDAERWIYLGNIEAGREALARIDRNIALPFDLRDEVVLHERIGAEAAAEHVRTIIAERKGRVFGDHLRARVPVPPTSPSAAKRSPPKRAKRPAKRPAPSQVVAPATAVDKKQDLGPAR